jgi:hypothetical protein
MDSETNTAYLAQYVKVTIMRSRPPLFIEHSTFNDNSGQILRILFTNALIAVATTNHLLAPLHALLDPNSFNPADFEAPIARRAYHQVHTEILKNIETHLMQRFTRTPIVVLVVDTTQPRWAATSNLEGHEHTILLEQRTVNIILSNSPEARLFGFAVFYREIAHLFRRWVCFIHTVSPFHCSSDSTLCSIVQNARHFLSR